MSAYSFKWNTLRFCICVRFIQFKRRQYTCRFMACGTILAWKEHHIYNIEWIHQNKSNRLNPTNFFINFWASSKEFPYSRIQTPNIIVQADSWAIEIDLYHNFFNGFKQKYHMTKRKIVVIQENICFCLIHLFLLIRILFTWQRALPLIFIYV